MTPKLTFFHFKYILRCTPEYEVGIWDTPFHTISDNRGYMTVTHLNSQLSY